MPFEVENFTSDVIESSQTLPVVVDFWAPWCGPCRMLGPVLEKLAGESTGRWKLVKVNTDQNQEISMQYGIRGIPAVKLFSGGQVIDEFTGALPEHAVRQWLDKALPSENKKRTELAELELAAGNNERAEQLLLEVVDEEPNNIQARVLLAQLLVFSNPEQAVALAEGASFAGSSYVQIEEAVITVARLKGLLLKPELLPDDPIRERYLAGIKALNKQDFFAALDAFINVLSSNRYYDDDGPRKACVSLFTLLGEDHPATLEYRRTFNMMLY